MKVHIAVSLLEVGTCEPTTNIFIMGELTLLSLCLELPQLYQQAIYSSLSTCHHHTKQLTTFDKDQSLITKHHVHVDVYVHILRHVSQIVNTGLVMLAHIVKIDWCNQSLNQLKIVTTHKMFKSLYSLQFALLAEKTCQLINHPQKDYPIWAKKTHNAHYDASEIKNTNLQLKHITTQNIKIYMVQLLPAEKCT